MAYTKRLLMVHVQPRTGLPEELRTGQDENKRSSLTLETVLTPRGISRALEAKDRLEKQIAGRRIAVPNDTPSQATALLLGNDLGQITDLLRSTDPAAVNFRIDERLDRSSISPSVRDTDTILRSGQIPEELLEAGAELIRRPFPEMIWIATRVMAAGIIQGATQEGHPPRVLTGAIPPLQSGSGGHAQSPIFGQLMILEVHDAVGGTD